MLRITLHPCIAALALLLASTSLWAQGNFESRSVPPALSGNWNDNTSWTLVSGTDADNIPDADDNVTILTAHTIFVNVTTSCNNLTLEGTGQLNFNTNSRTLTVLGTMTMNGNSTVVGGNSNRVLSLQGDFLVPTMQRGSIADVTVSQDATRSFTVLGEFVSNGGTIGTKNIGNVFINSGGTNTGKWTATSTEPYNTQNFTIYDGPPGEALIDGASTGRINIGGTLTVLPTAGGYQSKFGNTTISVTGPTNVSGYLIFTVSGSGAKTFNNTITILIGGTWDNVVGEDPTINCSIINNGNWPAPTGGLCRYLVTTAGNYTYTGTNPIHMGRLRINQGTVTNLGQLTLLGDTDVGLRVADPATFVNGNGGYLMFTATGTVADLVGGALGVIDFSTPSNTVEYALAGNQTIYPTTYDRLLCSNSGTKTQGGTVTVNDELVLSGSVIHNVAANTLDGPGNLVMTGTSELRISKTGTTLPELTGVSNSLAAGTLVTLNGTAAQSLKSDSQFPYQDIRINGGAGSAVDLSNVSTILGGVMLSSAGAITSIAPGGLTVVGTYNTNSTGATDISGGTGNLTVGSIVLAGAGSFNYSGKTITINGTGGAWTNNNITTLTGNATSTVTFTSGTGQSIGGTVATTFNNLTINNVNGVTLSFATSTVTNTLNLVSGALITGSNRVIANGTVTRTTGLVEGSLLKPVSAGTNVTRTFEVGTGATYTPATVVFASVSVPGTGFMVSSTAGDHPDILSANIEPNLSVNRYWSMTNVGMTFTTLSATMTFVAGDVDGGFSPATDAYVKGYNLTSWFNTTIGTRTATTTQFTGLAAANLPNNSRRDFQIGRRIVTTGFFNRLTGTLDWHQPTTWINNREGTITLTNGSAAVTGTNTFFTTELSVGEQIVLQSSPSAAPVTIASIVDDQNLTLDAPYAGSTASGGYGRLRVPNTTIDSVTVGNPVFTGGTDLATTIQLTANATVNTLNLNAPAATGRTTAQQLVHIGGSTLTVAANVVANQPSNLSGTVIQDWLINAGAAVVNGNLTIGSANNSSNRQARVVLTTGTLTVGGNILWNTSNNAGREVSAQLVVGSGRVNLGGSILHANNRGTLSMGATGVFNFNRTAGSQLIDLPATAATAFVFSNIECNNTSANGVQISEAITGTNLTGNIRVLSGKLQMTNSGNPDPSLTGNGTNTFEVANGATFEMLGNNDQAFPASFLTYTLGATSTVIYAQSFSMTLPLNPTTYGNISFTGTPNYSITNPTFTINGDLTIGDGVNSSDVLGSGTTSLIVHGNIFIGAGASLNTGNIPSIYLDGSWTNNGTFTAGVGTNFVEFTGNGASQPQIIGGSSTDTFLRLRLNTNDDTDIVQLSKNISVSDVLTLTRGGLHLNGNQLSITNASTAAISRTSPAYIRSETTAAPYSRVRWTINTTTGSFVYPFGRSSAAADYIPFTFNVTGAGAPTGTFEVSTYQTAANNTPYPSTVTNMTGGGDDNGGEVVDRFWVLTPSGFATTSPTSTLTFTCTAAERAAVTGNLRAQRWSPGNNWESPLGGQSNPGTESVQVPGVTSYSPWTLASEANLLPITLLSFDAFPANGTVELRWETATEINNEYFDVERSKDGEAFTSIGRVTGAGNSHTLRKYKLTDTYPLSGNAYYRLKQTDFNGNLSYSNVVRTELSIGVVMLAHPNPFDGDELNLQCRDGQMGDVVAVRMWNQNGAKAFEGTLVLDDELSSTISFESRLSPGLYLLEAATANSVNRLKVVVK